MGDVHHHRVVIQHRPNLAGRLLDGLHPVVQIVHLPTTANFPPDGAHQHRPVVLQHVGLYWLPVLGRLVDDGHIPQAGQRHVQRPGDGGGGEGEHIHLLGQLLQPLLVGDPEPLFLVDDQQAQILELDALLQQPMGADEDVHLALGGVLEDGLGVSAVLIPGQHADAHREPLEPPSSGLEMLVGQHGGGHQNGRLLPFQYALHHRPQGDLRLAIAHVAAQQPIHGDRTFHICLDLLDAAELVIGLLEGEFVLKFPLPRVVGVESISRLALALGVEGDELLGHLFGGLLRLALGLEPVGAAQLGQLGLLRPVRVLAPADELAHQVQLSGRHIQRVRPGVGQLDVILLHPVHLHFGQGHKPGDAVLLVHHQVTWHQVIVALDLLPVGGGFGLGGLLLLTAVEGRPLGDDRVPLVLHAAGQTAYRQGGEPRLGQFGQIQIELGDDPLFPQEVGQRLGTSLGLTEHHRGHADVLIMLQVGYSGLQAGTEPSELTAGEGDHLFGGRGVAGGQEGVKIEGGKRVCQPLGELAGVSTVFQPSGAQNPRLCQRSHVLRQPPLIMLPGFHTAGGFTPEHKGVLRQIVQPAGELRIDQIQIPVSGRESGGRVGQLPAVLFQRIPQVLQPLPVLLLGTLGRLLHLDLFLFQHAAQTQHTALRQLRQSLGGWEEDGGRDVLRPSLSGRVEQPHGVNFVPPELRPHRRFRRRREHVQQVAPQGELPRPLHLVAPGVPGGYQTSGQLSQVAAVPQGQGQRRLFQQFRRQGALQQPFYRSHHQRRFLVGHGVEQI